MPPKSKSGPISGALDIMTHRAQFKGLGPILSDIAEIEGAWARMPNACPVTEYSLPHLKGKQFSPVVDAIRKGSPMPSGKDLRLLGINGGSGAANFCQFLPKIFRTCHCTIQLVDDAAS